MPRHAHAHPQTWSKSRIGDAELAALRPSIVAHAAAFGFDLPEAAVQRSRLEHADAIRLAFKGSMWDAHHLEYPMRDKSGPDDAVALRWMVVAKLLDVLHQQRVRDARRRELDRCVTEQVSADAHYDAHAIARWATALSRRMRIGLVRTYSGPTTMDIGVHVEAQITGGPFPVEITRDSVILKTTAPTSLVAGMVGRRLGDVVSLPRCGDASIDADLDDLTITAATARDGAFPAITLKPALWRTTPYGSEPKPSQWRRLRRVRPFCPMLGGDYGDDGRIDLEAALAGYRASCLAEGVAPVGTVAMVAADPEEAFT